MPDAHPSTGSLSPLKRPLAIPAAALALGILAGSLRLPAAPAVAVGAAALVLLIVRKPSYRAVAVLVAVTAFFFGAATYGVYTRVDPLDISRVAAYQSVTAIGVVEADPEVNDRSARLTVDVRKVKLGGKWLPTCGKLLASQYGGKDLRRKLPAYGDLVALTGRVTLPSQPTNPDGFSYRDYLARQRIYSIIYINSPRQMRILSGERRNSIVALAGRVRRWIADSLDKQMPAPYSGIAAGMALGTYATLPSEIFDNFTRTGTLHLLAASGFNCAVIVFCLLYVFQGLRVQKRWAYAAAVPVLIFYMLIVGVKPSIVRATIMASIVAFAYISRRISDPLNILFAAAIVILAWRPTDLFDVGFQLSFAAVAAIVLVVPTVQPWVERLIGADGSRPRSWSAAVAGQAGRGLTEAMSATIAATLGTLPITAHYFNQVSLVSVPVNALVAMLAPAVLVISLCAPAVAAVPLVGQVVASADVLVIKLMLFAVNGFGSLSWSCVTVNSPGALGAVGYYLFAGTAIAYLSRQNHKLR